MKNVITTAIIAILLTIIVIQKACTPNVDVTKKNKTVTKIVNVKIHDTIYTTPKLLKTIVIEKDTSLQYLPDTNYILLKNQYQKLVKEHLSKNVYIDKLNLDTLGNIIIRDTTQFNKLGKRSYQFNLNIPRRVDSIFVTNTIYTPLKRQVYLGVGITLNQSISNLGIRASFLYKDKKDNIFSPSIIVNTSGNVIYGIDTYFKIKLKK
jgi:hypothetical protein